VHQRSRHLRSKEYCPIAIPFAGDVTSRYCNRCRSRRLVDSPHPFHRLPSLCIARCTELASGARKSASLSFTYTATGRIKHSPTTTKLPRTAFRRLVSLRIAPSPMAYLFPSQGTLHNVFAPAIPIARPIDRPTLPTRTPYQARTGLYNAWSVVDDAKNKANQLSKEATAELHNASDRAKAQAEKIELYSRNYYAACTFGGLLACVCGL
jgi:hypothetical protein